MCMILVWPSAPTPALQLCTLVELVRLFVCLFVCWVDKFRAGMAAFLATLQTLAPKRVCPRLTQLSPWLFCWVCLSCTAGEAFCFVFRGVVQNKLSACVCPQLLGNVQAITSTAVVDTLLHTLLCPLNRKKKWRLTCTEPRMLSEQTSPQAKAPHSTEPPAPPAWRGGEGDLKRDGLPDGGSPHVHTELVVPRHTQNCSTCWGTVRVLGRPVPLQSAPWRATTVSIHQRRPPPFPFVLLALAAYHLFIEPGMQSAATLAYIANQTQPPAPTSSTVV